MIDLEKQKENFKNHIATFTDYGNIKILDFMEPNTSHYRIRFQSNAEYGLKREEVVWFNFETDKQMCLFDFIGA